MLKKLQKVVMVNECKGIVSTSAVIVWHVTLMCCKRQAHQQKRFSTIAKTIGQQFQHHYICKFQNGTFQHSGILNAEHVEYFFRKIRLAKSRLVQHSGLLQKVSPQSGLLFPAG